MATRYADYDQIGAWARRDVTIASHLRLVYGDYNEFGELVFRPKDPVTREEMAAMVVRCLGYSVIASTGLVGAGMLLSHYLGK